VSLWCEPKARIVTLLEYAVPTEDVTLFPDALLSSTAEMKRLKKVDLDQILRCIPTDGSLSL
jgi:hypothetical protein